MAGPHEPAIGLQAALAFCSLAVSCLAAKKFATGMFAYGLAGSAAVAVPAVLIALQPAGPAARAAADLGVLLAGAMALAASGWLISAFRAAGDAGGR